MPCVQLTANQFHKKIEVHLFHYCETNQQQSFANFVTQKLLQSQSDLSIINQELLSYWKCIELHK